MPIYATMVYHRRIWGIGNSYPAECFPQKTGPCQSKIFDIKKKKKEEIFYMLLLLLLSYGTILAVERQTWCGTAPICRETMTHLYGALGDTTYSRDETDTGCRSKAIRCTLCLSRICATW